MTVPAFVHRHYSAAVGESPIGHVVAVAAGLVLIAIGAGLIASVVFVAPGIVIALVGGMLLGVGLLEHIASSARFTDLLDALIGLTGAAIAMTLMLAIAALALGIGLTVIFGIARWLAQ